MFRSAWLRNTCLSATFCPNLCLGFEAPAFHFLPRKAFMASKMWHLPLEPAPRSATYLASTHPSIFVPSIPTSTPTSPLDLSTPSTTTSTTSPIPPPQPLHQVDPLHTSIFHLTSIHYTTSTGNMVMTRWTPELHEEILVAFAKAGALSGSQTAAVMAELHGAGHTFTESALKYVMFLHPAPRTPFLVRANTVRIGTVPLFCLSSHCQSPPTAQHPLSGSGGL